MAEARQIDPGSGPRERTRILIGKLAKYHVSYLSHEKEGGTLCRCLGSSRGYTSGPEGCGVDHDELILGFSGYGFCISPQGIRVRSFGSQLVRFKGGLVKKISTMIRPRGMCVRVQPDKNPDLQCQSNRSDLDILGLANCFIGVAGG